MTLGELLAWAQLLCKEHGPDLPVDADGCDCHGEAGELVLDTASERPSILLRRFANISGKCPTCGDSVVWNGDGDSFYCLDCIDHGDLKLKDLRR